MNRFEYNFLFILVTESLAIKSKIMLRQDLLFKTKPRNKDEVYKAIYSDMKSCINDWIYKELCEENDDMLIK